MSDQQMAELYERLVAAKFAEQRPSFSYPYKRGWNAGLDFAIKQMRLSCDEVVEAEPTGRQGAEAAE